MAKEEILHRIERVKHLIKLDENNPAARYDVAERRKELAILESLLAK